MKQYLKKFIAAAAALSALCTSTTAVLAEETVSAAAPVYTVDFESDAAGTKYTTGGQWYVSAKPTAEVKEEINGNKYLRMTNTNATTETNQWLQYKFIGTDYEIKNNTDFTISYRVMFNTPSYDSGNATDKMLISNNQSGAFATSIYKNALSYQKDNTDANNTAKLCDLKSGIWYNITWVYSSADKVMTIYVDNALYSHQVFNRGNKSDFNGLCFNLGKNFSDISIDDINVYPSKIIPEKKYEDFNYSFDGFSVTGSDGSYTVTAEPERIKTPGVNNLASADNIKTVSGKFGKDASDASLYMNNPVSASGKDTYMSVAPGDNSKLKKVGDSQTLTFNCAFDDNLRDIMINGYIYNKAAGATSTTSGKYGGNGGTTGNILVLKPNEVTAMGTNKALISPALSSNKWYTVTLNVTMGEEGAANKFSLYIDDTLIFDNCDVNGQYRPSNSSTFGPVGQFYGFNSLWFNYNWSSRAENYKYFETAGGIYFDDISLTSNFDGAKFTPSSKADISRGNDDFDRYVTGNYSVYSKASTTAGDLKNDMLNAEKGISSVKMMNSSGAEIEDSNAIGASTIYAQIKKTDGQIRYVKIDGNTKNVFTLDDGINTEIKSGRTMGYWSNNSGSSIIDKVSQKGGKDTSDTAVSVKPSAADKTGFLDYTFLTDNGIQSKNADMFKPVTVSENILIPSSQSGKLTLTMRMTRSGALDFYGLMAFSGGKITNPAGNKIFAYYEPGQWNRISVTHFPGKGFALSINGREVDFINKNYQILNLIRFETTMTDDVYIDDISVKSGYAEKETSPSITAKSADSGIEINDGSLLVSSDYSESELRGLLAELNTSADKIAFFTDSSLSEQLTASDYADNGAVLVAVKDNIYTYYTLKYSFSYTESDGVVTVSCVAENGENIIAGLYDSDDMLIGTAVGKSADGMASCNLAATGGEYIKAFLWNDNMKPSGQCGEYIIK